MKRSQLNLALVVVAAGLGAAVFWGQKKPLPPGAPLTALKVDAIAHVVIAHPGKPEIRLDKQNGSWMLTAPVVAEADTLGVNGVLSLAGMETKKILDAADIKRSDLGLDPPAYTVKLNDVAVQFGGVEPLNYQRYVEVGNKLALIDDPPATTFDDDYSDLVSKSLLPADAQIEKIEVPGLTVARSADGKSWETTPASSTVTQAGLQQFVDGWKTERSMWNQPAPATPFGDSVTITLKDRSIPLLVVIREPQLVLERADLKVRYTLSKADADKLLKLPEPKPAVAPKVESKADGSASTAATPASVDKSRDDTTKPLSK